MRGHNISFCHDLELCLTAIQKNANTLYSHVHVNILWRKNFFLPSFLPIFKSSRKLEGKKQDLSQGQDSSPYSALPIT